MKKISKRSLGIAVAALAVLVLAGCDGFLPAPSISGFTSNVDTTFVGETVYFTVSGSTMQGGNYSIFQDYSGTVSVAGTGATGSSQQFELDSEVNSFSIELPVKLDVEGPVEILATVTDSNGISVTSSVKVISVGAERANEGTIDNPVRLVVGGAGRVSKVGTGTQDRSYYQIIPTAATMTITNTDQSTGEDLDFEFYSLSNFTQLYSSFIGPTTEDPDFFSLTPNDPLYMVVINDSNSLDTTWTMEVN
jgi:hypothetical protein